MRVWTEFVADHETSLADLSAGAVGRGFIVVYVGKPAEQSPQVIVELSKHDIDGPAVGRVYANLAGVDGIGPRQTVEYAAALTLESSPAIVIEAPDGWWRRGAYTNYNLDVSVFGGVYSLWSPTSWIDRVREDQRTVDILVRDREGDGVPDYDLRRLRVFPQEGYYHVNYAERMCDGPLDIDLGLVPEWPFIASPRVGEDGLPRAAGGYEQRSGELRPPIVIDWSLGSIRFFSELVTLRNQSCSFGLYSIRPIVESLINALDFETPFAFYDLRGARDGFPDLIIRSVYSPARVTPSNRVPRDTIEGTRYSWRVDDRADWDLHFDYKVELAGSHTYDAETDVADGLASITAPSWPELPEWLMDRDWPFVTFVSTEGSQYRSNEGIYEWSTRSVGTGFLLSAADFATGLWQDGGAPNVRGPYSSIRGGLRGEFRIGDASPASLYLSPLSNRLHLLGALRGVHNLGSAGTLYAENLVPDPYLDSWRLVAAAGTQRLVHLPGWLLLASDSTLSLAAIDVPHSLDVVLPPTDNASWVKFRQRVLPVTDARRPASDLTTWFAAHADDRTVLNGVDVVDVWYQEGSVRFQLDVTNEVALTRLEVAQTLTPDAWVLVFNIERRQWSVEPALPPNLFAALAPSDLVALTAQRIDLVLANRGTSVARGNARITINETEVASWAQLTVPAQGMSSHGITWIPPAAGTYAVTLEFAGERTDLGYVEVLEPRRVDLARATVISLGPGAFVLAIAALSVIAMVSRAASGMSS